MAGTSVTVAAPTAVAYQALDLQTAHRTESNNTPVATVEYCGIYNSNLL